MVLTWPSLKNFAERAAPAEARGRVAAWQAGAGLEFHVWQFVYGIADARITRVTEKHLRGAGAEISSSFFTRHVDFGVALRLPR